MKTLTLLVRAYCHLCDEMLAAVQPLATAHDAILEIIDVDAPAHAALEAAWGDQVPVLLAGPPRFRAIVCRYHFDRAAVERALGG